MADLNFEGSPGQEVVEGTFKTSLGEQYAVVSTFPRPPYFEGPVIELWGDDVVWVCNWYQSIWRHRIVRRHPERVIPVSIRGYSREWRVETPVSQRLENHYDGRFDGSLGVSAVLGMRPHLRRPRDIVGWATYVAQEGLTLEAMAFEAELGLEPCVPFLLDAHTTCPHRLEVHMTTPHIRQPCPECEDESPSRLLKCRRCHKPFPCAWSIWLSSFPSDYPYTPPPLPRDTPQ